MLGPQFNRCKRCTGVITASFTKRNALSPTPFFYTAFLPWTLGETHSTSPHRSLNSGDICERRFPQINVLKNVFPPSLRFHITSPPNDAPIADKARTTDWVKWGSTCAGCCNKKMIQWESSVTWRRPCQHPMHLSVVSQGLHWESEALRVPSVRYLTLHSFSIPWKVNQNP